MSKSILELKDQRALLLDENQEALKSAKGEMRKLNDGEMKSFNKNLEAIKQLDEEIRKAQENLKKEEKRSININTNKEMKEKQFNLLTAIRNRAEGRSFSEAELEVINAGREEMRKAGISSEGDLTLPTEFRADIVAGTATAGQEVVGEDKMNILKPLRENLVLAKAGATYLTGLTGDISIPTYGGTSALWEGEVDPAGDGAGEFGEVKLAPKRLSTYVDISKKFLAQDSASAEAMLKQDIVQAIAGKLEATILGKENVSATQPGGLFFAAPSISGAASFKNIVDMEAAVDSSNALMGNLKYICGPEARAILKTTDRGTDTGRMLLENGELNGYEALVTNHVAKALQAATDEYGIVFGNWADFIIAQWGGIDLVVDPYTVAKEGKVRLVVNAYFDAKARRAESFKTGSLK